MKITLTLSALFGFLAAAGQPGISNPVTVAFQNPYGNMRPRIALNADQMPVIIWTDGNEGNVFASVKTESGFSTPQQLNPAGMNVSAFDWSGPEIAAKDNKVVVVMKRTPEMTESVYIVKSEDGGVSWSDTIRVENSLPLMTRMPGVGLDPQGNPVVSFLREDMNGFSEWAFARSTDGGATFLPSVSATAPFTDAVCDCCPSAVAANATHTAVVYRNNESNLRDIRASLSNDEGLSFDTQADLDNLDWVIASCPSSGPSVMMSGNKLHSAWMSKAEGNTRVYYSSADPETAQSEPGTMIMDGPTNLIQNFPGMAGDDNIKAIVWESLQSGQRNIQFAYSFAPEGFVTQTVIDLTDEMIQSQSKPHMAYASGVFHLVYTDHGEDAVIYQTIGNLTSIDNSRPEPAFSIYPNPTSNGRLNLSATHPILSVRVTDLSGRTVVQTFGGLGFSKVLDVSTLASGTYLIQCTDERGKALSKLVQIDN